MFDKLTWEELWQMGDPLAGLFPTQGQSARGVALAKSAQKVSWTLAKLGHYLPSSFRSAVPARQYEYLLGRAAAAVLLVEQGYPPALSWVEQNNRRPIWPVGVVGSISHSDHIVWVRVSNTGLGGIGCDVERLDQPCETLRALQSCFSAREISGFGLSNLVPAFSAKEALFKCINPLCDIFFDHLDAEISHFGPEAFVVRLVNDVGRFRKGTPFLGHHRIAHCHVWTEISLRSSQRT